jgi:anaerobic selenocysteine-containing dehydrogenase
MTEQVISYCRVCPALCGIVVEVERETQRVVAVRGDRDHPLSRGYTCVKGRSLPEEVHAPDRLTGALRRDAEGRMQPVTLEVAIAEIADRITGILDAHGPRSVALYVGTRGYELLQLAGARAWLQGTGSPAFYSTYTIDQPGKDLARARHGSWPAGFQDVATSDVVMLVGTNPVVSAVTSYIGMPMTDLRRELRRMKDRGLRLVVIDPRRTETAVYADVHLRPMPGTDAVVLAGLLRVILGESGHDQAFADRFTRGLDELRRAVEPFTPEFVESRSGVPGELLQHAARVFAQGPRGCAIGGTGINMSPHPTLNEYLLLCLNTVCGRYRRAGEVVTNPGVLSPGRSPTEGPRGPRSITGRGEVQPRIRNLQTMYDQMPSAALADEILTPGDGQVRALVVSGGNPLVALPDADKTLRALQSLELLVSLDVRLSQTARLSDYVIACPLSLEKADSTLASDLRFPKPFAQCTDAVVPPAPELVEEWDFFRRLATAMGTPWELSGRVGLPIPVDIGATDLGDDVSAEDLWRLVCSGGALSFDDVRGRRHGIAPALAPRQVEPMKAPVADRDRLELADRQMLAELALLAGERVSTSDPWPFLLTSRRMVEYYNSWGQDLSTPRARHGSNPAFVHPTDLRRLGMGDGDHAVLESEHGLIEVIVASADDVAPGTVSIAHCWGTPADAAEGSADGSCVNLLISNELPVASEVGMARQSAVPVRIRPVGAECRPGPSVSSQPLQIEGRA